MDLTSESGATVRCTATAWGFYRALAESYGWSAHGTLPPPGVTDSEWDGTYDSNDGQTVTSHDAAAFAFALERVLEDPARQARQRTVIREQGKRVRELALRIHGVELPDEDDSEPIATDAEIRELVTFLRQGGLRID